MTEDMNMEDGMFAGMDMDELTATISKGTYRIKLDDVADKEANTEFGEPDRRFKIFNFSIEDERPEVEDFYGERVKGVFLNYWPNLKQDFPNMDATTKSQVRRSAKLYQTLARAFGADEAAIASGNVVWNDYVGQYVYATLFPNKSDGEPQAQTDSFVNESAIEL